MDPVVVERPEVNLSLDGPRRQRRATVAFRAILAIPHLLYLYVLQAVATLTAFIAWVAAVFTGRMPEGIGDFLSNIVQYSVRVYAYLYLITDQYPPFSLGAADYPVSVALPPPTRLNRAAVLFRLVIAVPAFLVITLVSEGYLLPMLVIWLIVLVSGRLPNAAFEVNSSYLRYQTRFYAWFLMLTPEYPRGLFGDQPQPLAAAAASSLPPPPPPPRTGQWGPPRITRLVLSKAGKRLLGLMVALGAVFLAGTIVLFSVIGVLSSGDARRLDRHYEAVRDAEQLRSRRVQDCAVSQGGFDCVHAADRELEAHVRTFVLQLQDEHWPEIAVDDVRTVRDEALQLANLLATMSTTSDQTVYNGLVSQYDTRVQRLDDDESSVYDEMFL